jgi:pSer/pThr/pTyr-binding forkhead associated (FHA) protein
LTSSTLSTNPSLQTESYLDDQHIRADLRVVRSPSREQVGTRIRLSSKVLSIGREPREEGLRLDDVRLSRTHARIAFDSRAGVYRIGDSQSHNGTFVNGERIDTVGCRA